MTKKLPVIFKQLDKKDLALLNNLHKNLYQLKVESLYKRTESGVESLTYQSFEHGEMSFTATGSATISKTFSLIEKQNTIVHAHAHAYSALASAHVTDVTKTSVTIILRSISGTGDFSSVVAAPVTVYYQIVGSNP